MYLILWPDGGKIKGRRVALCEISVVYLRLYDMLHFKIRIQAEQLKNCGRVHECNSEISRI